MKKRQAAPDVAMATAMGVASYIPKNQTQELRADCEWTTPCDRAATNEVTEDGVPHRLCDDHTKEAQISWTGSVNVRRRKRG